MYFNSDNVNNTYKIEIELYNNLKNTNNKILQPQDMNITLMEHQKTAIHAMIEMENKEYLELNSKQNLYYNVGILGDKVGSGKTYMIIGLILSNKIMKERQEIGINCNNNIFVLSKKNLQKVSNTNLLIIPHKLLSQWKKAFLVAPSIKIFYYDSIYAEKKVEKENMEDYDIVVVPAVRLNKFEKVNFTKKWKRLIIDEADTIKLTRVYWEERADFTWLISGTLNGKGYSSNLLIKRLFPTFAARMVMNNIIVKNNDEFIDTSIKLPLPTKYIIECNTPNEMIIKDFIPSNVITLINSGNTEEAIKVLNYDQDTTDNIFNVLIKNINHKIKNKNIDINAIKSKMENDNIEANKKKYMERIKKIEIEILQLEGDIKNIRAKIFENDMCSICLGDYENPVILTCCNTKYCFECITLTIKSNICPNCTKKIKSSNIKQLTDKMDNTNNKVEKKQYKYLNKIDVLVNIINENPSGKFIVFADYVETLDRIVSNFKKTSILYACLKGSMATIDSIISRFKKGEIQVILLNAQYCGAGLNLEMASDIIMYHRFNESVEGQIIGRAQRLGRVGNLKIHYLVHNNEIHGLSDAVKIESKINLNID